MGVIAWIILGLLAGALAKAISPSPEPSGWVMTAIIGVVGALVGGFLGSIVLGAGLSGFSLQSLLLAVVGAVVLLWLYRITRGAARTTV